MRHVANAGGLSEKAKYFFGTFIEDIYFFIVIEWAENVYSLVFIVTKGWRGKEPRFYSSTLCIARGVIIGVLGEMEILQKDRFIF